jgi:hypothetical protein
MKVPSIHRRLFIRFRRRRMERFYAAFRPSGRTRVLDIGGAPNTWFSESPSRPRHDGSFSVTFLNLRYPDRDMLSGTRFTVVEGDAARLPFPDASFDIAFSNSVIEHMTTWERQQSFAAEARRVARALWIQTPARSFPIEPHLLAPYFQYLPRRLQPRLVRRFTLWGLITRPNATEIDEMLSDIRLLTRREMQTLFPDCVILCERVCGLAKSYIAVRGIPPGFRLHGRASRS